MHAATPESKLVTNLIVDDAINMFSRDTTTAFIEKKIEGGGII